MRKLIKKFTLLEVVVAVAVFSLALISVLSMAASATKRVDRAFKRWESQHILAQAAEYLIIAGFDNSIPDEFVPNDKYRINVELAEPEGLPEDVESEADNWKLVTVKISLLDINGSLLDTLEFDRLIYQESK